MMSFQPAARKVILCCPRPRL